MSTVQPVRVRSRGLGYATDLEGEAFVPTTVVAPTGFATWWANICGSPSRAPPSGLRRAGWPLTAELLKRLRSDLGPCGTINRTDQEIGMTLHLIRASRSYVAHASDRLVSGGVNDPLANKQIIYLARDALVSIGYAGIAYGLSSSSPN